MLIDSKGRYLVENHVISYQFSAKFLTESPIIDNALIQKSVGFAPFNKRGFIVGDDVFSSLAYAEAELEGVVNQHFLYHTATKEQFLNVVESASIIHLATHAKAEKDNPERAFIAFFPEAEEFRLFYDELFSLDLQRVKLVFLSACDTHTGNILNSEGLISLSRAFAYAGCANIVGSIWKAEDKVVAYLSQRFYGYLKMGNSMPKSLQLAKVDLLNDPAMAQFNHPYFWSSLVFIGGNAPDETIMATWLPPAFISVAVLMLLLAWNYRRQPTTDKDK
jgi:CHAT domain-containing protein